LNAKGGLIRVEMLDARRKLPAALLDSAELRPGSAQLLTLTGKLLAAQERRQR
jgi:hypothetical protein